MDCGHGWRNENDCDVCRPSALVVAGLRGRNSELEAALTSARIQLVTLGGDPRPDGDAIQCAVLDVIDEALGNN